MILMQVTSCRGKCGRNDLNLSWLQAERSGVSLQSLKVRSIWEGQGWKKMLSKSHVSSCDISIEFMIRTYHAAGLL